MLWNEVSLKCYPEDIFQPAKFDNFKDEKISDCKTVSVPKRKKLAGLKIGGLVGLWATFDGSFFMFSGTKKNISATALKSYIITLL